MKWRASRGRVTTRVMQSDTRGQPGTKPTPAGFGWLAQRCGLKSGEIENQLQTAVNRVHPRGDRGHWTGRLGADTRGALLVEYTVLIGGVALAGIVAFILLGAALVRNFDFVRGFLLCPIP